MLQAILKNMNQWNKLAGKQTIKKTIENLRVNGFNAEFVVNDVKAKEEALKLIPAGAEVFTVTLWHFNGSINDSAGNLFSQSYGNLQFTEEPSEITPTPTPRKICAQVITYAKNSATNECKTFPTPCDVPTGWTTVPISCTPCAVDIAGRRDAQNNAISDGYVNGWDFSQMIGCRSKKSSDKIWSTCKKIDINSNGTIDDSDWNIFVSCVPKVYNKQCQK